MVKFWAMAAGSHVVLHCHCKVGLASVAADVPGRELKGAGTHICAIEIRLADGEVVQAAIFDGPIVHLSCGQAAFSCSIELHRDVLCHSCRGQEVYYGHRRGRRRYIPIRIDHRQGHWIGDPNRHK